MRQRIVAVTGVSGVGKTTCLKFVAKRIGFQHLQASALIQSARASQSALPVSHDDLRKQDIDQNQTLLLSGFAQQASSIARIIVIDGHTIIEVGETVQPIGPAIFGALRISRMVFLWDDPSLIAQRRQIDIRRSRPNKLPAEIHGLQAAAAEQAQVICEALEVPLTIHDLTKASFISTLYGNGPA